MQPTFPAILISSDQSRRQFLLACGDERDEPTVLLWHYIARPLQGALAVDATGAAFHITDASLSGVNWRWVFVGGPVTGVVVLLLQVVTLTVPVRVRASYAPAPAISLGEFKAAVLARIAASTNNFMGCGDASAWRPSVNTAKSFSQLVDRLCLRTSTA